MSPVRYASSPEGMASALRQHLADDIAARETRAQTVTQVAEALEYAANSVHALRLDEADSTPVDRRMLDNLDQQITVARNLLRQVIA